MRHYRLSLEGSKRFDGDEPLRFTTIVEATDEYHAKQIAQRVYGYFTLTHMVEIMTESNNV